MRTSRPSLKRLAPALLLGASLILALRPSARADEHLPLIDRSLIRTAVTSPEIDTRSQVYTNWIPLLTVTPGQSMKRCKLIVDLAKATTGFAAQETSVTIQFALARRVDGTNWRTMQNTASTAISGTAAGDNLGVELNAFEVTPTEGLRLMVKLSAENATDIVLPTTLIFTSGAAATTSAAT